MALVSKPKTFSAGATIVASEHNSNFDTIYNDYNGNITNANVAAAAAIADTKLAQITTASKVSFTALDETSEAAGAVAGHDGSNWSSISASTQRYKVLMSMGSTSAASFQSVNLESAASITGTLPAANLPSDNIIKAWARFQTDGTILNSYNVTQAIKFATGKWGVYWDTDFANSTYAISAIPMRPAAARVIGFASVTAGALTVEVFDTNGSAADTTEISVIALGDQ